MLGSASDRTPAEHVECGVMDVECTVDVARHTPNYQLLLFTGWLYSRYLGVSDETTGYR